MSLFHALLANGQGGEEPSYEALSGETTFAMNDILGESLTPELYIAYEVPAAGNCPLLVYLHGWDGGGGIIGAFHTQAIADLKAAGIAILGVGMRGRNTGTDFANSSTDVEEYRDASALELYDVKASIEYFVQSVAASGQINTSKYFVYGISGGGGNAFGLASKFPDLFSMIVSFYGISKYGTYTDDPNSSITSWYSDQLGFQSAIQKAVCGAPGGTGIIDAAYLARDHSRAVRNYAGKLYMYHDEGDNTVHKVLSDLVQTDLLAAGKTEGTDFVYHESDDGSYGHGNHALSVDLYDGVFGMEWLADALSLTKPSMPASGTLHVAGYVITDAFTLWIKKYRKNVTATPRAQAMITNQGKFFAATVVYNNTNETYQITPIISSTSDQYFFVDITKGAKTVMALVSASDTVTLQPKTVQKFPLDLSAYDWEVYFNFGDATDGYVLDDQSKVSNVFDLTGNNHFAFQHTRATRAAIVSGSLDNGVMYLSGTSGTLAANVDSVTFSGEFTIVFSCDPDAATVTSLAGGIIGRGAGGASGILFGTFSGKVQISIDSQTGTMLSSSTPTNSNVGKQAWFFRRDASNHIHAKCVNSSGTYDYGDMGELTGIFEWRTIGSSASSAKGFAGKIYKVAAANEDIGDTDATSIIQNWYAN